MRYVQSDMTVGDQSISFDWLLALRLAAEVAPKLTGDRRLKSELMQDFIFWSRHFMAKDHNKALRNKTYYDEYEESDFPWAWRR
ncbi:MAG: hypothetical protein GWN40_04880 [Nitrosopumilaceae archaeon]|nr:hypothetical protein [Nitrosopumilaceae archaeon]